MGIRFRCHHCESELHVKDFQAGKRGRCPQCGGRFRVPLEDAPHSLAPETQLAELTLSGSQVDSELGSTAADRPQAPTKPPQTQAVDSKTAGDGGQVPTAPKNKSEAPARESAQEPATRAKGGDRAKAEDAANATDAAIGKSASAMATGGDAATAGAAEADSLDAPLPPPPQAPPPQPAIPRALQVSAESKWYVRPPSGGQYGPAANTTMWQWLAENRVGRDSLVWTEGWPEWVIAESAFDDFFQASTPPAAAVIPPAHPAVGHGLQLDSVKPSEKTPAVGAPRDPLLGDRNRAERKQQRRRNYILMIAGLATVMLILIGTLIFVLSSQAS